MIRSLFCSLIFLGALVVLVAGEKPGTSAPLASHGSKLLREGEIQSSDVNLKIDIRDMKESLRTIMLLKPRQFKYREDMSTSLGFIAQELEEYYPELVTGKNGAKRINYAILSSVAIKGIQELYRDLEEARAQLTETQKLQTEMKLQIERLEMMRAQLCKQGILEKAPGAQDLATSQWCISTQP